uniref:Protein SMG9 n=1 Tax=Rhabditophanes sp. KR3021 TaxID=114890 RepID=A0AC35TTI6_9BILA
MIRCPEPSFVMNDNRDFVNRITSSGLKNTKEKSPVPEVGNGSKFKILKRDLGSSIEKATDRPAHKLDSDKILMDAKPYHVKCSEGDNPRLNYDQNSFQNDKKKRSKHRSKDTYNKSRGDVPRRYDAEVTIGREGAPRTYWSDASVLVGKGDSSGRGTRTWQKREYTDGRSNFIPPNTRGVDVCEDVTKSKSHKFLTNIKILSKSATTPSAPPKKPEYMSLNRANKKKLCKYSSVLINDSSDFEASLKDLLSDTNTDYTVVSIIGEQGCGKSSMASLLCGNTAYELPKKPVFRLYNSTSSKLPRPNAPKAEMFITKSSLIVIDLKAILPKSSIPTFIKRGKDYFSKEKDMTTEEWIEVEQMKLLAFALSVSHTVMLVADNYKMDALTEQLIYGNRIFKGLYGGLAHKYPNRFKDIAMNRQTNIVLVYVDKTNREMNNDVFCKIDLLAQIKSQTQREECDNLNFDAYKVMFADKSYNRKVDPWFVIPKIISGESANKCKDIDNIKVTSTAKGSNFDILTDRRTTRKINFITNESNFLYDDQENNQKSLAKEYSKVDFPSHIVTMDFAYINVHDEDIYKQFGTIPSEALMAKEDALLKSVLKTPNEMLEKLDWIKSGKHKGNQFTRNGELKNVRNKNREVDAIVNNIRQGINFLVKYPFINNEELAEKDWLMFAQNIWKELTYLQIKKEDVEKLVT